MQNEYSQFEQRKRDHIELALMPANQSSELNPFDHFSLVHEALPDLDFKDISIQSIRFKKPVEKPFIISSMTAGHSNALEINYRLMEACSKTKWAMGVGSQRRELTDKQAAFEWAPLRRDFHMVSLFSNLGIAQLIDTPISAIERLIDTLQAEALIIHCNPLQECIQPEGTTNFQGCWAALEALVKKITSPVIIKETGCGFSKNTLLRLNNIGVAAVDVSGVGGTHWGRIEGHRANKDPIRHRTADTFRNWGIDTLQSIRNAISLNPSFETWGSGGVRNGLDAAKLFALGASTVGFAKPMLEAALDSTGQVLTQMNTIEYELKTAMFCTGSRVLDDLKEKACP
ncbi:TPA: type 2 isopentenyl-diphosphate Delta-isomerase [Legionella pneumophila]|nr:type 2 isopentenyl-diphosphate Delta-isomerase [Legionella pneumophila]HAT8866510.1 type 2 isopentenyl-diphosphate Delta-isomerase [Legionella pneumophila subsp. pneumophila]HAT7071310.1 type 2 isopentenyl-diphosphate Delta-isomerase [Legionella pneumophila]HAT8640656.1 type 2 isopentenyl-diphosphate Delta-isomerase [Legionella pneumophila]HAT8888543.1 type 2 isopentenyl-diphosphate Delta-isomerase [Legionella pneumophila subsp. pneumophila]HAU0161565.1 type 2 isopentenyl-diphosphate Delta-